MAVNQSQVDGFNEIMFLSRLCGGEFGYGLAAVGALFLSRLCGGEC